MTWPGDEGALAMKPYYEEAGITIFHGDCREILPTLGPVDLVLTDPPYGLGLGDGDEHHRGYRVAGDQDSAVALDCLEAVGDLPVIAFASPKNPWPGKWRQWLVWDKGEAVGGGGDVATCWKFTFELIQVARSRPLNGSRDGAVLRFHVTPAGSILHPSQKPEALMRYLVRKATNAGDTILDPFMGSGTTLRAAKDLGRKAIGIEIEERYCEIAAKRLSQGVLDFQEASA